MFLANACTPCLLVVLINAATDQHCIIRLGDDSQYIDATRADEFFKFVNHSCAPNVYQHTVSSFLQIDCRISTSVCGCVLGCINMFRSSIGDW